MEKFDSAVVRNWVLWEYEYGSSSIRRGQKAYRSVDKSARKALQVGCGVIYFNVCAFEEINKTTIIIEIIAVAHTVLHSSVVYTSRSQWVQLADAECSTVLRGIYYNNN